MTDVTVPADRHDFAANEIVDPEQMPRLFAIGLLSIGGCITAAWIGVLGWLVAKAIGSL
jgi:hypothetical protein